MARRAKREPEIIEEEAAPRAMLPLVDLFGLALIAIRWFTPTEGTFRGDTLWIAQLWLGWGVLASWNALRNGDRWARRGGLWTGGLTLLTLGHVLAGLAVVFTEGQKRAALNGLWEWISLGLAAVWFHHRASSSSFRRTFRIMLIASAMGLSVLGIWQRWVSQPELGRAVLEFDDLESRLPALEGRERFAVESRLRVLGETIGPEYRALDAQGRMAMRQRLLESSEPLGRFALANSLAALLMVALCLLSGEAIVVWSGGRDAAKGVARIGAAQFATAGALLLITFVLLLTKSRTAWIGGLTGGAIAAVVAARERFAAAFRLGAFFVAALCVLVLLTWAAGGLDRPVVTEAAKSLEYRMEYWIGAWRVIQEHPWLGIGPGNFRQHYLAHKLEKSSEEVLDPHHFLLEAWATGGLMAIAGLLAIIAAGLIASRRVLPAEPALAVPTWRSSAPAILLMSGMALVLVDWWLQDSSPWELGITMGISVLAAIGLNRALPVHGTNNEPARETATLAAWIALSVHLLGAGGMEMPAIIQLWLCLSSLIVAPRVLQAAGDASWPSWTPNLAMGALLAATIGQGLTATRPSLTSRALVNLAHSDATTGGRIERIDERLRDAAGNDPLDPDPWRQRAQLAFREWTRTRNEEWFQRAIEYQQQNIARDPLHAHDHRALAEMYLGRFQFDHRPEDAQAAVDAVKQALALYPNQLTSRRTLAEALDAAGRKDEAKAAARAAVELDALWLRLGHFDKTLSPEDRSRMKELANDLVRDPKP